MKKKWTKNEIDILIRKYSNLTDDELVKIFKNRTLTSIKVKAKRLKLYKNKETEFKNRSNAHIGKRNGMYGKTSNKFGKTYDEYYGTIKSKMIRDKISNKKKNGLGLIGENNGMYGKSPYNKGKSPSNEIKNKIKIGIRKYWDNLSADELEKRKKQLRKDWIIKRDKYSEIDTIPEKITEKMLNDLGINYEKKKNIGYYNCDFKIKNKIIEVQGDYWHGNPNIYNIFDIIQTKNMNRDLRKIKFLNNIGYDILCLWEYDIKNNLIESKQQIKDFVNDGKDN